MQNIQKGKSDCIKHFTKSVSSIYNKCYSNLRLYLTKRLMNINKTNIYTCVKDKSKKNKCHEPTHAGNFIICHFNFVILKGFNGLIVRFWNFLSCNRFMENSYLIIKNCIYFKQHTLFKKWILVKMAGNVHRGKKKVTTLRWPRHCIPLLWLHQHVSPSLEKYHAGLTPIVLRTQLTI